MDGRSFAFYLEWSAFAQCIFTLTSPFLSSLPITLAHIRSLSVPFIELEGVHIPYSAGPVGSGGRGMEKEFLLVSGGRLGLRNLDVGGWFMGVWTYEYEGYVCMSVALVL